MTLPRSEVNPGLVAELNLFGALISPLDDEALASPTRCAGWTVADVAAHVIGSMADVVSGRLEGLGTEAVTAREVLERRGRSLPDLCQELAEVTKLSAELAEAFDDEAWAAPAPGGYEGTLGQGVEALWYDTYLHGDDIRAALSMPSVRGAGLRCGVHHVAFELSKLGWGPATLAFDGIEEVPVGAGGKKQTGDALAFILAVTGRADAGALELEPTINIYA